MKAPSPRVQSLDGLRGIAVMGILLMNIAAFAMPVAAYSNPLAYGGDRPIDLIAWGLDFILVDGKMRSLFSLLFGASMLLVIEKAEAAGQDAATAHFRRMGWLLVFGLIHYLLIWWGDILTLYAVAGCAAWFLAERSPRTLVRYGVVLIALQVLVYATVFVILARVQAAAAAPGASADDLAAWIELRNGFGIPEPAAIASEIALHRGGYDGMVADRLCDGFAPLRQIVFTGAETLGLMLLGMAGLKSGFLTGGWDRARYRRAMAIGYGIGLPATAALAGLCWWRGFDPLTMVAATLPAGTIVRPFVLLGHVALILSWLGSGGGAVRLRVIAAGRAAFTNYLGTSIVMTSLFYGHGFGLFGSLGRAELHLVVFAAWAAMLLWSKPWLDRFAYGPLEWLWRSLARGEIVRLQPN